MGEYLGPFDIQGQLGRGAMAIVWRAYDPTLEREVALKEAIIPHGLPESAAADMSMRFVREAKTAARLNHPGIVTIYNADVYSGRPVIVMELIPGQTLAELLDNGPLDERTAASILDQLLDAIGYAHERGIVHRDIKPENVFVLPDGRVKLADFGVAHIESSSTLTQAGTVLGTPGYMAPEQITGQAVDARTDIFAVGVIGYEMLTGSNPFGATNGDSATAVMFRVVQSDVPDVVDILSGTTPRLSETLRVAMAKDPDFRFGSAAAMRDALRGGPIVLAGSAAGTAPGAAAGGGSGTFSAGKGQGVSRSTLMIIAVCAVGAVAIVIAVVMANARPSATAVQSPPAAAAAATTIPTTPPTAAVPDSAMAAEEPAGPSEAELAASAEQTVRDWKSAWESMNLSDYMAFYSPDFRSNYKGYNLSKWRNWKAEVFGKYSYQTVDISGLKVKVDGTQATVTFKQVFTSDSLDGGAPTYRDVGRKTLRLEWDGSRWLITGEEWVRTGG